MFRRLSLRRISRFTPFVVAGLMLPVGCSDSAPQQAAPVSKAGEHDDDHGHHHHSHGEKGPHNGALVAIGEDAAHLEVVLDAATGKVTVYVLDGEAKNAVSIKAEKLELAFTKEHDHGEGEKGKAEELPETATLVLAAVSPGADGTASEFAGESEALKGAEEFDAVLATITIGDKPYPNVKFNYPEGNEHDHHHHH